MYILSAHSLIHSLHFHTPRAKLNRHLHILHGATQLHATRHQIERRRNLHATRTMTTHCPAKTAQLRLTLGAVQFALRLAQHALHPGDGLHKDDVAAQRPLMLQRRWRWRRVSDVRRRRLIGYAQRDRGQFAGKRIATAGDDVCRRQIGDVRHDVRFGGDDAPTLAASVHVRFGLGLGESRIGFHQVHAGLR